VPLIQPEKKITNDSLTATLPCDSIQEIRAYAQFLHSGVAYVLTQLIATLGRDKEFQQWKAKNTTAPSNPTRESHPNKTSTAKE
jgi:hypothetical protein